MPKLLRLGTGPEGMGIDAAIGLSGDRIDRPGQRTDAVAPGERAVANEALRRLRP